MNQKKLLLASLAAVSVLFASCATNTPIKPETEVAATSRQTVSNIDEAKIYIEQIIEKAKNKGAEDLQYIANDLYSKGSFASLRGDYETSTLLFSYVQKLNPQDNFVKKRLVIDLIKDGKIAQSEKLLEEVYKTEIEQKESIGLILGGVYTALDKKDKAITLYKEILTKNESEEACIFLAKAYATDKKIKEAIRLLDGCEKSIKGKGIFSYYKGKILIDQNKKKEAFASFKKSLSIEKDFYQAALGLGLMYEEEEKHEAALKTYLSVFDPRDVNYSILGRIVSIMFLQEKFDEVLPYAEMQLENDPNDLNLRVKIAIIYSDKKQYVKAKDHFSEILNSMPDSDKVLYYMGVLSQETRDFDQAMNYFSKIPDTSPLFSDGHLQMVKLQSMFAQADLSKKGELLKMVEVGVEKFPNLAIEYKTILASYYDGIGDVSSAIQQMSLAQSLDKFSEDHAYYLAALFEKNKQIPEAQKIVVDILKKNPQNTNALNFMGYTLMEEGKELDKAYTYLKKAYDLKPEDGFILDSLAWYHFKKGDYKKALDFGLKARAGNQDIYEINKHLAIIYQKLNNTKEAYKYLQLSRELASNEQDKLEIQKVMEELEGTKRIPASK